MNTLDYISDKYDLPSPGRRGLLEIPNAGRDDLARLYAELGFRAGAEIGVEQGKFTEALCRENPRATIHCVDSWRVYPDYRRHVDQALQDELLERTKARLKPFDNWRIVRKFSMDAVRDFEDGELDFVYVDANHSLPYVINDIIEWSKKVRPGGIVSGHDYRKARNWAAAYHVVYAVDCYVQSYRIRPWFLFGRKARVPGEVRDKERSWMWVR